MEGLVKDFLAQKIFAVAGSFRNETKYAYRIFNTLRGKGYEVYPVNPAVKEVGGVKCYAALGDIPVKVDVVDLVTSPRITMDIVRECKRCNIKKVWMQPGAESREAIAFCKNNAIEVIHGLCVMLEAK